MDVFLLGHGVWYAYGALQLLHWAVVPVGVAAAYLKFEQPTPFPLPNLPSELLFPK